MSYFAFKIFVDSKMLFFVITHAYFIQNSYNLQVRNSDMCGVFNECFNHSNFQGECSYSRLLVKSSSDTMLLFLEPFHLLLKGLITRGMSLYLYSLQLDCVRRCGTSNNWIIKNMIFLYHNI